MNPSNGRIIDRSLYIDDQLRLSLKICIETEKKVYMVGPYDLSQYLINGPSPDFYFIERLLKVSNSKRWEDLVGKTVRIILNEKEEVIKIGDIIYDSWIDIYDTLFPESDTKQKLKESGCDVIYMGTASGK